MRFILGFILAMGFVLSSHASALPAANKPEIQSFKEWKSARLQSLYSKIEDLRGQYAEAKKSKNAILQAKLMNQVIHFQGSYEMASDLTFEDYFFQHIAPSNDPDKFAKAAQKLSADEVVMLMKSYSTLMADTQTAKSQISDPAVGVLTGPSN